ncbi:hypothetical protein KCP76_23845 [Salmonella enterica subsp. enterica serovar Weltevreden]|nr:hypothetical protein KCP76_23845 [Salmonella enterica subsp. enterica serovar Weltevreden]
MMAGNGFYNARRSSRCAYALTANPSLSGGVFAARTFNGVSDGPRYNMNSFTGKVKPSG